MITEIVATKMKKTMQMLGKYSINNNCMKLFDDRAADRTQLHRTNSSFV